jgi:hypothetical protein
VRWRLQEEEEEKETVRDCGSEGCSVLEVRNVDGVEEVGKLSRMK